jgi:hypothetical protein
VSPNMIPIIIIPAFCATIAFVIKIIVEARARARLLQSTPPELALSILTEDERRRRHSSLKWGIVLVCLAVGFMVVELAKWDEPTPGALAVLLAATGIGNIASYLLCRSIDQRDAARTGERA